MEDLAERETQVEVLEGRGGGWGGRGRRCERSLKGCSNYVFCRKQGDGGCDSYHRSDLY